MVYMIHKRAFFYLYYTLYFILLPQPHAHTHTHRLKYLFITTQEFLLMVALLMIVTPYMLIK